MADKALCSISGCNKPSKVHTLCMAHYMRKRRHGSVREDVPVKASPRTAGHVTPSDEIARVIALANREECWAWVFQRDRRYGYGFINIGGKKKLAHRVVCEAVHGAPPTAKHEAAHSCGKGHEGCVNPHHLAWKTRTENEADKRLHGTNRGPSPLTISDVIDMRRRFAANECTAEALASQYGMKVMSIVRILQGKRWVTRTSQT